MYAVSDAYKKAIQDNTRSYYWTGKITLAEALLQSQIKRCNFYYHANRIKELGYFDSRNLRS